MNRWQWAGLGLTALAIGGAAAFRQQADAPLASARSFAQQIEAMEPRPVAALAVPPTRPPPVQFDGAPGDDPFQIVSLQASAP